MLRITIAILMVASAWVAGANSNEGNYTAQAAERVAINAQVPATTVAATYEVLPALDPAVVAWNERGRAQLARERAALGMWPGSRR